MEDLELFKKRIEGYIQKAYNNGVTLLSFLDDVKISVLEDAIKHYEMSPQYYGGFIGSDRVRAIISLNDASKDAFKIVVYRIKYNKRYYEITHRSILGSIMALGIKRECIGDILITEDKNAYFACTREISEYIYNELHAIGSAAIELEIEESEIENVIRYEEKLHFLSSMRLDVILASSYQMSRSEAFEYIKNGLVSVNHVVTQNPSKIITLNQELSVRHKGRVKIKEIGGISKSGRIAVLLAKRV